MNSRPNTIPTCPTATPISRRAILTGSTATAAVMAATTIPAPAASCPSLAKLEEMIACHAEAWQADEAAHYAIPEDTGPLPRVQVGRRLAWDEGGNRLYEPIWAYSAEDIDRQYDRHIESSVALFGRTPEREAKIRQDYADRIAEKKADLARQEAEAKRYEDASGFTAAQERASAASAAVKAIERKILAFVPTSLQAASRLAQWASETVATEKGYLYKDDLRVVLQQIASARAVS